MYFVVIYTCGCVYYFFFFKQKTAYEMRISDWSSDVCSSDLGPPAQEERAMLLLGVSTRRLTDGEAIVDVPPMVGRNVDRPDASRRDRVDKLEHALDPGPAIGAQQDVAAGAHTRPGPAAPACAAGAANVEPRARSAIAATRPHRRRA